MSLFDNVAKIATSNAGIAAGLLGSLASGGISGVVGGTVGGLGKDIAGALGGGKLANVGATMATNMASNAITDRINEKIPMKARRALGVASGALGDVLNGDWEGAGMRVLQSGLLNDLFPGQSSVASQYLFFATPTPVFGGISPTEAREIIRESVNTKYAKTNLFYISLESPLTDETDDKFFNMFATSVDLTPVSISAEKRRVGGAVIDSIQGNESVDLSITTLDDTAGTIKRWFSRHADAASASDGTVGVPASYAIKVRVLHAFLNMESSLNAYENKGLFRPTNIELSLSRREHELAEVRMTFSQLDTFMRP